MKASSVILSFPKYVWHVFCSYLAAIAKNKRIKIMTILFIQVCDILFTVLVSSKLKKWTEVMCPMFLCFPVDIISVQDE